MAFINEIYRYKKIFRDIEKATKKCVHLKGAIEYIYIRVMILGVYGPPYEPADAPVIELVYGPAYMLKSGPVYSPVYCAWESI